jgi:5-methylcytosine-specific restriction endonuclease McrA
MSYNNDDLNDIYERKNGYCYYCQKKLSFQNYGLVGERGAWEVDHFIPLAAGGEDRFENWVPACVPCNTSKRDLLPWEFEPDVFGAGDHNPANYLS